MKSKLFSNTILLALVAFVVSVLTACAAFQPAPPSLPPMRVEYTLWWGDYTLLVAKEKGFFEKHNVNVEPVYYPIFSKAYSDLAAGQIDAGLMAVGDVMSVARHAPMKVIGVYDDGGYTTIVARSEINSIRDLKGKSIGILAGTQYEMLITEMLASAGMNRADVAIVNVNTEEVPAALKENKIQAGFTWEPFTAQAIDGGAHILYPTDQILRYFPDMIAFRQDVVDQRPQEIRAFMQAWFEAVNYRLRNPEETRQIAAKYTGVPIEQIQPEVNLKIMTYEDNLVMYSHSSANSIFNTTRKTAEYLISIGALIVKPDANSILDPQYFIRQ